MLVDVAIALLTIAHSGYGKYSHLSHVSLQWAQKVLVTIGMPLHARGNRKWFTALQEPAIAEQPRSSNNFMRCRIESVKNFNLNFLIRRLRRKYRWAPDWPKRALGLRQEMKSALSSPKFVKELLFPDRQRAPRSFQRQHQQRNTLLECCWCVAGALRCGCARQCTSKAPASAPAMHRRRTSKFT